MTNEIKDCFRILDLNATASPDEVKKAWVEFQMFFHPDRLQHDPKLMRSGQDKLKKINAAYDTLKEYFDSADYRQPQAKPAPPPRNSKPKPPPPTTDERKNATQDKFSPSKPSKPVNVSPLKGFFIFLGVIGFFILFVIAQVYGNSTVSILLAVLVAIPLIIVVIIFIYQNGTLKDLIRIDFREAIFTVLCIILVLGFLFLRDYFHNKNAKLEQTQLLNAKMAADAEKNAIMLWPKSFPTVFAESAAKYMVNESDDRSALKPWYVFDTSLLTNESSLEIEYSKRDKLIEIDNKYKDGWLLMVESTINDTMPANISEEGRNQILFGVKSSLQYFNSQVEMMFNLVLKRDLAEHNYLEYFRDIPPKYQLKNGVILFGSKEDWQTYEGLTNLYGSELASRESGLAQSKEDSQTYEGLTNKIHDAQSELDTFLGQFDAKSELKTFRGQFQKQMDDISIAFSLPNKIMSQNVTPPKKGTIAFLDSKNGIGGVSFGSSVATIGELGFASSQELGGDGLTLYTNDDFLITFGDFYLNNISLEFVSDKLVSISGKVNPFTDDNDSNVRLIKFLTVLFGEPTSTQDHKHMEDGYAVTDGTTFTWRGNKIEMDVYCDILGALLTLEDYRPIKADGDEVQANQQKAEEEKAKAEEEKMLKQNF